MKRSSVRALFGGVFVFLVVQYTLVGVVGYYYSEPWPAVVMPGFQDVWDGRGTVTVSKARLEAVFAGGARADVPVQRLLANLPRTHHPAFLRRQCRPARLSGTPATERCRRPGAARWAARRLHALFPQRRPRRLDVIWTRLTFHTEQPQPGQQARSASRVRSTPLDTLSIALP